MWRSENKRKAPCRVCATATNSVFWVLRICGTVWDWLHDLTVVLTCVQRVLLVTNFRIMFVTRKIRWKQLRTIVKSCSQSQTVPQNLRTQNTELVAVAQTLQGAIFSFSLLRTDCRVCTQASLASLEVISGRATIRKMRKLFGQKRERLATSSGDILRKGKRKSISNLFHTYSTTVLCDSWDNSENSRDQILKWGRERD